MIRLFNKDKDYNTIARWWLDHEQIPCDINLLPNIGFIVDDIVVGFLYQTDSGVCFVESVVSDKKSKKEDRKKALDDMANALMNVAKEMNYKKIIFHTIYPSLKEQSLENWGFDNYPGSVERFQRSI